MVKELFTQTIKKMKQQIFESESILIKKTRLYLNREPQPTPSGRQIIYSACSMNAQIPAKYINREYKHHWIYSFKYIDNDTFVHFEFDYNNQYIGKV